MVRQTNKTILCITESRPPPLFILLFYMTFVYENKNQKSRGTFSIYFESLPIAGDFIECNRTIEPVPLSWMWAGMGNKDVFFFEDRFPIPASR